MFASWKSIAVAMLMVAGLIFSPGTAKASHISLALSLAIDVSGSVSTAEYNLQRQGYVTAFQSAAVQSAIAALPNGIAVNFVQWSSAGQQVQSVGWTLISNAAQANAFATTLGGVARAYSGSTAPGNAIQFAASTFAGLSGINVTSVDRKVIDISGDGEQNDGINTATARNTALAGGITTINGLAIGNASLGTWYQNNIVGGTNAFMVRVDDFNDFSAAIEQKLAREISAVPVPAGAYLACIGIVCLAGYKKLNRKQPLIA
jgi:hypothetical protein